MAKNKNNNFKGKAKDATSNTAKTTTRNSAKNSHAEVPDNSPNRSGPGGE